MGGAATVQSVSGPRGSRWRVAAAAIACVCLLAVWGASGARSLARVAFPSLDRDESGAPVPLQGVLLLPDGPVPQGGYPAIVALHGCSGMYAAGRGRDDLLAARLAMRAEPLLGEGYAVLYPDSFGSRGVREVCTVRRGENAITPVRRRLDALGALAYLAGRGDIAGERIALVGWSHGGSTALAAINARDPEVIAFREQGAVPFFRAAVAYYPGCSRSLREGEQWQPAVATRIHIGALDDWTPPKPCVDLGAAMAARGEPLEVSVYPDSYHAFDAPNGAVTLRTEVPNGVHPGRGVHVGANPAAREKAIAEVRAFLHEQLRVP
jgi:dienelactone hydrolase